MEYKEARPTEYKGVVCRSKSEAIIYRSFELAGWQVEYEPIFVRKRDGTPWDFHLCRTIVGSKIAAHIDVLLEYKPSKPTNTYLEELYRNINFVDDISMWAILWGSPFNAFSEIKSKVWPSHKTNDFLAQYVVNMIANSAEFWSQAKRYRFDLERHF